MTEIVFRIPFVAVKKNHKLHHRLNKDGLKTQKFQNLSMLNEQHVLSKYQ